MNRNIKIIAAITLSATVAFVAWIGAGTETATAAPIVEVYKSPTCGCCKDWVTHMRENGFEVNVHNTNDVAPIKKEAGVPQRLSSCHTAMVDGYVIEGHVPADDVKRMLTERPAILGISAPGMPVGSPGMEMGDRKDPYSVVTFDNDGKVTLFSRH
ncbi:MAG: DUF411 domain-containing protein [Gammaproteobacteria bacterium]|uniref:DUF411 domain-containing protein n=1 Tax=Candidatus Thiopontia autotrophica TaxID=2841688 RepID=A0A8J6PBA9_9GAMM|nr:DUF411 domain-containing protein [Candidatus Thiopontia autotrophica]MBL6969074.1 DUF411 domain-containing protein [Gammaproteobacteria bacterium]